MQRMKKANKLKEMYKFGMNKIANQISITPDELANNFEEGRQVHTPTLLRQRPNELSEDVSREDVGYLSKPVDTLTNICKMQAAHYFFHPVIRTHLKKICSEKLYIKTRPTVKGRKTLTVYHYYFPAKRITGKRMVSMDPFLWMLVMEAESKGLVKVEFVMDYDKDPNWSSLLKKIKKLILDERKPASKGDAALIGSWNQVRTSIAENLIKYYAKPEFEKEFKQELTKKGKNYIKSEIKKEFKQIINIKSYRPQKLNQEDSNMIDEANDLDPYNLNKNANSKMLGLESVKVLACTMTSSLTTSTRNSEAVFVALNEKGHIDGILRLKNCFRKSAGMRNPSKQALYDNNIKGLKDFVIRHLPKVIVISPKSLVMQGLKIELNDLFTEIFDNLGNEMMKPFVMWGDNRVAEIASRCESSKKFIDSNDETVCEAVSLGRYVQDPLAETLNLWSHRPKENLVLKMALHPMQDMIPTKELHNELESVVLEIVGNAGVNVNRCFKVDHRASPLQFVSGLGPRKAEKFIQSLKSTMKDGYIANRSDLEGCGLLSKNTYIFCIGFLRFYNEDIKLNDGLVNLDLNLLDLTRIHPDNYSMANKMVLECLQVDFGKDDIKKNHNEEVLRVMSDPEKLQELDLVDYGKHLSSRRKCNMHWQIQFIEKELAQPFLDPRDDFRTNIDMIDLFYKLTNENKHVLYENALILMQIKAYDTKGLKLSTNHGVQAIISQEDLGYMLGSQEVSDKEISEKFPVNSHTHVRVRKIDYIRLRLNVSVRDQDLSAHKEFLRNSKILEKWGLNDDSFKVYKDEDYPLLSGKDRHKFKLTQRFVPRKIVHPSFKNMPLANAQDYLKDRPHGDFVVRPSSQGNSFLNITWKIFPKIFCHLLIKEGHKSEEEVISQQLFLSKEKEPFRSLDDIIESYLKPVNLLVRSVTIHPKFLLDTIDKVKDKVRTVKKKSPNKIPYFFSSNQEFPQYLVLTYILHKLKIVHELIKLKPDGYIFHDQKFFSIEDLISFFKKNLKTSDYSKFVEKNPMPSFGKKRSQREMIGRRENVKLDDRHAVKIEGGHRDKYKSRYIRKRSHSSDPSEYAERRYRGRHREMDRRVKREHHRSPIKRDDHSMVKREETSYGGNYMHEQSYQMGNYNQCKSVNLKDNQQYKRVKPSEQYPQNVPYISNYPNSFMGHGHGFGNMPMNMNYMHQSFQQNDLAMANYTHNMNMMSANMNPFGNIPPPPPQHPMPRFEEMVNEKQNPQNEVQIVKKEEN
jgi:transcription elongation factor SPT6